MTQPFHIRRMHPGEAEVAATLLQGVIATLDFYNAHARRTETGIYTAVYLQESLAEDPDSVLVADAHGRLVGCCVSRYDDDLIWLAWFVSLPEWRSRGVGRALLEALHEIRAATGVHKIWCDSRTDNHASRRLLANLGYREICTIADHWYRQDYVLLEKHL